MKPHMLERSALDRESGRVLLEQHGRMRGVYNKMCDPAPRSCCMCLGSRSELSADPSVAWFRRAINESGLFSMSSSRTSKLAPRRRRLEYLCSGIKSVKQCRLLPSDELDIKACTWSQI